MKIFLDSVDIYEINKAKNYGLIDGITTNPSLIASSPMSFEEIITELRILSKGDISIEVVSNSFFEMVKEGNKILERDSDLVIKLPVTWEGIKACSYFSKQNVKVNMTLCFSLNQALLSAKAGATYISPFVGRLEDIGENGIGLVKDIVSIYKNYLIKTKVLAASIRTLEQVKQIALAGTDAITLPIRIWSTMLHHDLTEIGIKKFSNDWIKSNKRI